MKNKLYTFSFLLIMGSFLGLSLQAQKIYLQQSNGDILQYLSNGYLILKTEIVDTNGTYFEVNDIAITPSGGLFGVSGDGELVQIERETGIVTRLTPRNTIHSSALVCSGENKFIYLDWRGDILEIDSETSEITFIGSTGQSTPGDVTLHKGNVIFPTHHELMAYNIQRDSLYTIFCFDRRRNDFGIVGRTSACSNTVFYLTANKWDPDPLIYALSSLTKSVISVPQSSHANGVTYGMASDKEFLGLQCVSDIIYPTDCLISSDKDAQKESFALFPNPTDRFFEIRGMSPPFDVEISTISGQLVRRVKSTDDQVDIRSLSKGTYVVKIFDQGQPFSRLLMVN